MLCLLFKVMSKPSGFNLTHNCDNIIENEIIERTPCKCSIIKLLFRFNIELMNNTLQKQLLDFFTEDFFKAMNYKEYVMDTFLQMSNFVTMTKIVHGKLTSIKSVLHQIHFQIGSPRLMRRIIYESKSIFTVIQTEFRCLENYVKYIGKFNPSEKPLCFLASDYFEYIVQIKEFEEILAK